MRSNPSNRPRFLNIDTCRIISLCSENSVCDPCHDVCRISPPGDLEVSSQYYKSYDKITQISLFQSSWQVEEGRVKTLLGSPVECAEPPNATCSRCWIAGHLPSLFFGWVVRIRCCYMLPVVMNCAARSCHPSIFSAARGQRAKETLSPASWISRIAQPLGSRLSWCRLWRDTACSL